MSRVLLFVFSLFIIVSCSYESTPIYEEVSLPDPFLFVVGSRMVSADEWPARRAEIADQAQEYEFGEKPAAPDTVSGTYSEETIGDTTVRTLTVVCSEDGDEISFDCPVILPSAGTAPYPAMIGIGWPSLNYSQLSGLGVAVIVLPNDDIAEQEGAHSRGTGKFYDLYGSSHSAGAMMAWAWGVSRLIDALETTPEANIDYERLGVTGCSRNGKGALTAGAFDERIVLTIPQESGAGGAASWRISQAQKDRGQNVQTLSQIVTENCWFRANFGDFGSRVDDLPLDQHMIEAMCAPRGLLIIENTAQEWLGNRSTWANSNVAHLVWEALGVSGNMGVSQVGHSDHCVLPVSQEPVVGAFIRKFLLDETGVNTNILETDGHFDFEAANWVDWTVPEF